MEGTQLIITADMSPEIFVYKITHSEVNPLNINFPDFDTITTKLPAGLYTTFRTYAGRTKVIGLRSHLDRLYLPTTAQQGIIPAVRQQNDFRHALVDLLNRFDWPEARLRLILDTSVEPGTIYVLLQELAPLPEEIYRRGVYIEFSRTSRDKPSLKRTTFIQETALERKRLGDEVYEILLTEKGRILEGMTSNFFYARDGILFTAGRGVLIGVTRQTVISLARREGIKVRISALRIDELASITEAFITSSSRGIVPVVRIDSHPVGDGKVGEITTRLMHLYREEVYSLAEDIL